MAGSFGDRVISPKAQHDAGTCGGAQSTFALSPVKRFDGFVAATFPLDMGLDEIREALLPLRHRFSIALHGASNPFAVGAIVRVAHNFLAQEILLIGEGTFYAKATMGMQKYETLVALDDDNAFFEKVRGRPVWAFEREASRRSLYAVSEFPDDVVFLFGSERFGLAPSVLARANDVLGIPLYGVNQLLPLAVAAGIVMNEWARQRYSSGRTI